MQNAYLVTGIAALIVLAGGWYAFNKGMEGGATAARSDSNSGNAIFTLTSPAFEHNGSIPSKYTCDTSGAKNPPLVISGVPSGTKSLALLMYDPDLPKSIKADGVFDHWTLFNIPAGTSAIGEGEAPGSSGANGIGLNAYMGPCPPPQYEPAEHGYVFKLYALDDDLDLTTGATKSEVLQAIEGHVIAETELIGRYRRK